MPRSLSIAVGLTLLLANVAVLVWFYIRCLKRSQDPVRFLFKTVLTAALTVGLVGFIQWIGINVAGAFSIPFACVAYGVAMSIMWAPQIARGLAWPVTSLLDGGNVEPDPEPLYSTALAMIKRGEYVEAAFAIREQLRLFPTDLYGQTLLAQLQAEHLNDLPGAQLTTQRLVEQPGHAPKAIAFALCQLSEWHLKYTQDIEAARQALDQILALFPDTEAAQMAYQRIAHLASAHQMVLDARERAPRKVTPGIKNLGLVTGRGPNIKPPEESPAEAASRLVKHLEQYPADLEAREQVACIYAEHYQRLDMAIDQLEQIIQQPDQPAKTVVHCLNMIANLQVKCGADEPGARATLQRIIDLYPDAPAAELARQRAACLQLELRIHQTGQVLKIGDYEGNLGLKKGRPK